MAKRLKQATNEHAPSPPTRLSQPPPPPGPPKSPHGNAERAKLLCRTRRRRETLHPLAPPRRRSSRGSTRGQQISLFQVGDIEAVDIVLAERPAVAARCDRRGLNLELQLRSLPLCNRQQNEDRSRRSRRSIEIFVKGTNVVGRDALKKNYLHKYIYIYIFASTLKCHYCSRQYKPRLVLIPYPPNGCSQAVVDNLEPFWSSFLCGPFPTL